MIVCDIFCYIKLRKNIFYALNSSVENSNEFIIYDIITYNGKQGVKMMKKVILIINIKLII